MNRLEALIVIRCKPPKKLEDVWKSFKGKYRYDYISKTCSNLAKIGKLVKRKFKSPISKKVLTYYSATQASMNEAVETINFLIDQKMQTTTTTSIKEYLR